MSGDSAGLTGRGANLTRNQAVLMLILTAVLWSQSGAFIKLSSLGALAFGGGRSLITALVIWIYLRRPQWTFSKAQIGGALAYLLLQVTFIWATQETTAANAIFFQYTAPLFVALFGYWLLRERPLPIDWWAMGFILVGMVFFFRNDLSLEGVIGNAVALVSAGAMALLIICLRFQRVGSSAETILLGNLLVAAVGLPFIIRDGIDLPDLAIVTYLGIFQLGIPFILYTLALRHLQALETVIITSIEPVLNPVWAFFLVAEVPGNLTLIGAAIIMTAVLGRAFFAARRPGVPIGVR